LSAHKISFVTGFTEGSLYVIVNRLMRLMALIHVPLVVDCCFCKNNQLLRMNFASLVRSAFRLLSLRISDIIKEKTVLDILLRREQHLEILTIMFETPTQKPQIQMESLVMFKNIWFS